MIALYFVALDFTEGLKIFQDRIRATRVGDTGSLFVIDGTEGKNRGLALVHRTHERRSLLAEKDSAAREFIKDMLTTHKGDARFSWADGSGGVSEHVVAFDYYDDWNWLVGCMARSDEFFAESARTRNYLILATLVIIVLAALAIHLCGRAWISRPLEQKRQ